MKVTGGAGNGSHTNGDDNDDEDDNPSALSMLRPPLAKLKSKFWLSWKEPLEGVGEGVVQTSLWW
jgi:hypothetical protein